MRTSDRVKLAWDNCLQHGDSEEVDQKLREGGLVEAVYTCWDEFEADADFGRPDIGALLLAGAELDARARGSRLEAFVLPTDGNGCWAFLAPSEDTLLEELLRAGAEMESAVGSPG